MKKLLLILLWIQLLPATAAVTYTFSGGRLGDNLLAYCHAQWIAYTYNIPLLYKPFEYSEQLYLHFAHMWYSPELEQQFDAVVEYKKNMLIESQSNTLYVVPYFSESIFNRYDDIFTYLFDTGWQDPLFKNMLRNLIRPINSSSKIEIPADCISVALHIRKGTGWDIPNYRISPEALTASHPLRFAPDSFFSTQLKKLVQLFWPTKLYVHLFTDHNDPAALIAQFKQEIAVENIIYGYRTTPNNEFINVLEDFFALTQFDCLIRADSNFSIISSKLGNYKIVIFPWHGRVENGITTIDEISFEIFGKSFIMQEVGLN